MENLTEPQEPLFNFNEEQKAFDLIIGGWSQEKDKCKDRRDLRENHKNVSEERQKGTLLGDETIIPDRTINTNIKRGRNPYVNYITQSQNILLLQDIIDPNYDTEQLQLWFTRGMRYSNKWKQPWLRILDAILLHGGCAMEVIYDPTKPCNVALDFIPREELLFDKKTKDLQAQAHLLRRFDITALTLKEFTVKYQFNTTTVDQLLEKNKGTDKRYTIYRVLMKKDGVVYNCWYSDDDKTTWLREPRLHEIGLFDIDIYDPAFIQEANSPTFAQEIPPSVNPITGQPTPAQPSRRDQLAVPLPLDGYPIFWIRFDEQEDLELLRIQGRASLDHHTQEAMTHLLTNVVNGTTRASNFYPCARNEPGENPTEAELGPLKHGVIRPKELVVWQAPWPDASSMLAVMDALQQQKTQETGNADYAAVARKDANKTATEMDLASSFAREQSGTELTVFSAPFLEIYTLSFEIARQQAIMGLCIPPTHKECLFHRYHITAASDTEVIKREEDKNNAKEFFQVVKGTPAASKMLMFLFNKFFPDQADEWNAAMAQPDLAGALMQALNIIKAIPTDELEPGARNAVASFVATAQTMVGTPADAKTIGQSPV